MRILSLDTETLQAFLQGKSDSLSDHAQKGLAAELRRPLGVVYSDWAYNHAAINGMRTYRARPKPHPVGMKAWTENMDDKTDGWAEDTTLYPTYQSYNPVDGTCSESLHSDTPRGNFDPTKTRFSRY